MQSGSGIHDARDSIGSLRRTFWCPEMDCLYHSITILTGVSKICQQEKFGESAGIRTP